MIKKTLGCSIEKTELPGNIKNALTAFEKIDLSFVKEGTYLLEDGSRFIFSSYETRRYGDQVKVEGHKKFIDIQIIFEGEETIGVLPANEIENKSDYDGIDDIWTAEVLVNSTEFLNLKKNDFLILFPNDAHAPQLAVGNVPLYVKKGVIKVNVQ
jgi:biofilm protein TabA